MFILRSGKYNGPEADAKSPSAKLNLLGAVSRRRHAGHTELRTSV